MKIHSAPSGGQKKIRRNFVNVPADVSKSHQSCRVYYKNSILIKEQGICYDPSWSYVRNETQSKDTKDISFDTIPGSSNDINQAIETSQKCKQ